jgi:CheY-specific phosphatase CheX
MEEMERKNKMNQFEELANEIIDEVSDVVEMQHPELKLNTKIAKEAGIESPAVICGDGYYRLEVQIAEKIKEAFGKLKYRKYV